MKNFYEGYSFVISFLVLELFINMSFGESVTVGFLWLVLFSMIMTNSKKFTDFLNEHFFA